jgi:hypothetical protein
MATNVLPSSVPQPLVGYRNPSGYIVALEDLPDYEKIVTEDGAPVDNIYTEKQQRLLTAPLYACWPGPGEGRTFRAFANVGLFHKPALPGVAPDMMLAFNLPAVADVHARQNRSYFLWEMGKSPEFCLEIVSDQRGDEEGGKMALFAQLGVAFYVIYDPLDRLGHGALRAFALTLARSYEPTDPGWLAPLNLGLQLWSGVYEDLAATWLRWCSPRGELVPTPEEKLASERALLARERTRIAALEAQLRAHGIEPNQP